MPSLRSFDHASDRCVSPNGFRHPRFVRKNGGVKVGLGAVLAEPFIEGFYWCLRRNSDGNDVTNGECPR
jgi:hypothetical protein